MKIIKARNQQPAGNLFYHDHAMKSTKFNVAHGLSGLYILYNKTAEQYLPQKSEEKFVLFSHKNDGDLRDMAMSTDIPMKNKKAHTD
jgi:FtsP/CotA-like multicopper oxidase with cupredoxin domain